MDTSNPIHLLVVEDNRNTRVLLHRVLEKKEGIQVSTAEQGFDALIQLQSEPDISVVIIDWEMPEMSGMELLKTMKASDDLKDIPVIILTGKEGREHAIEALKEGAYYYLNKPIEFELLHAVIRSACGHQKPTAAANDPGASGDPRLQLPSLDGLDQATLDELTGVIQAYLGMR